MFAVLVPPLRFPFLSVEKISVQQNGKKYSKMRLTTENKEKTQLPPNMTAHTEKRKACQLVRTHTKKR